MKPLTFILTGLIVLAVLVGIFYSISVPVLSISIMKDVPQLSWIVWMIVIGVPLVLTAQIMRMVYDMFKRRKR
jgi:hypothetical protein